MNSTSKLIYSNAAIGQQEDVLFDIRETSKNIAIFQRDLVALQEELDQIMPKVVEFRATGPVEEITSALQQHFDNHHGYCPNLLEDILQQLHRFQKVSGAGSFKILFTIVDTNMCRRFHTDLNSIRLLCTYVGQGTMWLPDEIVNQNAFIKRGNNEQIVLDKSQIQQVGTGDVIILKGALYPDANPIVHRSPTIEEYGESRLLLRIDTNDFLNFDL